MAKVLVTKDKLDSLANSVAAKSGVPITMTIDEMKQAVDSIVVPSGTIKITSQGNFDVTEYANANIDIDTDVKFQSKTVTPIESKQTITADTGYSGLSTVTVNAISSIYVGSAIPRKTDSDLAVNGAKVTIPDGYYANTVQKTIPSGSATTPATTITANPTISVSSSGLITATADASQSVTPTIRSGYISSGTVGTITVSGTKTQQLTTLGTTTYNTSTSNQTISSGRYITGTQTIRAVTTSNITAANIAKGVTVKVGDSADDDRILNVTGTYTSDATAAAKDIVSGQTAYVNGAKVTGTLSLATYYTGSSTPSSSLGNNGDIYFKTS